MSVAELDSNKIVECDFNLDLLLIEIKEDDCLLLSGYGELILNKVGTYYIKFFCDNSFVRPCDYIRDFSFCIAEKEGSELIAFLHTKTGERLEARGFEIEQNNILGGFENEIFKFHVSSWEWKETIEYPNKSYIHWECLSKFNLEGNESVEYEHDGIKRRRLDLWAMKVPNGEFSMQRHREGFFSFKLHSDDEESIKDFIEVSSMFYSCISGRNSNPYLVTTCNGEQFTKKYISINNDTRIAERRLSNPIEHDYKSLDHNGDEIDSYSFIYDCLFKLRRENPDYFKILRTAWVDMWSLDTRKLPLNIVSLVYGVTVEGILTKVYMPNLTYLEDPEFLIRNKYIRRTIGKVKELTVDERAQICQHVARWGGLGSINILRELYKLNLIDNLELNSWVTLRNSSAHADVTNDTEKNIADITRSVSLFNSLFFAAIGYNGDFTKFHPPIPRKKGKGYTHYSHITLPRLELFNY